MYKIKYASIVGTTTVTREFRALIPRVDQYPPSEAVIEYASRLCYDSNEKFGTNPNFIKGLIKAGHLDVLEHSALAIKLELTWLMTDGDIYKDLFFLKTQFPYLKIDIRQIWHESSDHYGAKIIIVANLRTWQEYVWEHDKVNAGWLVASTYPTIKSALNIVAPNIFGTDAENATWHDRLKDDYERIKLTDEEMQHYRVSVDPLTSTKSKVMPIGVMQVRGMFTPSLGLHHSAYLVNDVSRAFSHQHVRHRLMSYSQMSQRYVDYEKQGDGFVFPHDLTFEQHQALDIMYNASKVHYEMLRKEYKFKKEDARSILPNGAITHLVFSSFQEGMDHYLKLRTASDAQYEIRQVALKVQEYNNSLHGSVQ